MKPRCWEVALLVGLVLLVGLIVVGGVPGPTYTDAYYYFNAGHRLASGEGLTDPYIALTYLAAPQSLPAPSHVYWMPLPSLLVALAGGSFRAAQNLFLLLWLGLVLLAFWLGSRLGGTRRHAWAAGLLVLFSGFYVPFLLTTDTFTPFGLFGALSLFAMGQGRWTRHGRWFVLAGGMSALAHLTRADGMLFVIVLAGIALLPTGEGISLRRRIVWMGSGLAAYALVMLPWFARNLVEIGTLLPTGGFATAWLRGYNEIVSYPPSASLAGFLDWGLSNILGSRWEAFSNNLGTFVAVEGLVVLSPLIIIGVSRRWRDSRWLPVWVYAVLLHVAMTFVFAFPGYRGGLFHSASALLPWWAVAGLLGLDDVVDWAVKRRRHWRADRAKQVFTVCILMIAIAVTVSAANARLGRGGHGGPLVAVAEAVLPQGAVVMSNDPSALYYYTGLSGIVVPDAGLDAVALLVEQYGVTHVLLDENYTLPLQALYDGEEQAAFLQLVPQRVAESVRVFEVVR